MNSSTTVVHQARAVYVKRVKQVNEAQIRRHDTALNTTSLEEDNKNKFKPQTSPYP
jgi:hypothetical protein